MLAVTDLGTILSVWAHPDDETYLAGDVMAVAIAAGQQVVCVSLTAGERGTSDPVTWPPERLGRLRRSEAASAMAVLGVTDHRILDLPDGGLPGIDPTVGVATVSELLDEVRPDTILTFGPDGMTFHADHIATSRWVTSAWEAGGRAARLLHAARTREYYETFGDLIEEWGIYMTDERPVGMPAQDLAVHHRVEGCALDRKLAALEAMPSQTSGLIADDREMLGALSASECFTSAL